mgnify:CR=1 FL=1
MILRDQLKSYQAQLSPEKQEQYERLLADERFKGRQAMIRELHVYGQALSLGSEGLSAQHQGLGQKLLARAEKIAANKGYTILNVISSVGTRAYYRAQGFKDAGLYQQKEL